MSAWRKTIIAYKSISWLLIAAILLITLLPAHYHLHHLISTDSASHAHVVDLHLLTEKADQSHHDEGSQSFAAAPDGLVKNSHPELSPFILLALLLVLLPLLNNLLKTGLAYNSIAVKQGYSHFSPPLRAPPLL